MILRLEFKKLRRTGYIPAFLTGGVLASAFPIANMAFRREMYLSLPGSPLAILAEANWQMMAMLNLLLAVCGACIMYHTEFSDNGLQKMQVLPARTGSLFLGKFVVTSFFCAVTILIETATFAGCAVHWFPGRELSLAALAAHTGFELALMLPTILVMLIIASACRNMWLSLGIGVILVFLFSILPQSRSLLALCPFISPYQLLHVVRENGKTALLLGVCITETLLLGVAGLILQKIRRYLS